MAAWLNIQNMLRCLVAEANWQINMQAQLKACVVLVWLDEGIEPSSTDSEADAL